MIELVKHLKFEDCNTDEEIVSFWNRLGFIDGIENDFKKECVAKAMHTIAKKLINEDKYVDEGIRKDDRSGNYTYTFNDGYNVNVSSDTATYPQNPVYGIIDANPDVNSITINGKINLTVNAKAAQQAYAFGVHNCKYTILDDISIIAEANAYGSDAVKVKSEGIYSTGIDSIIKTGKKFILRNNGRWNGQEQKKVSAIFFIIQEQYNIFVSFNK